MSDDEQFYAWLDGELDAEQAAKMEERVAASGELTARATEYRHLRAGLQTAFAPVIDAGVPPPSFQSAEVIDFGARATGREFGRKPFGVPQWAAMAATLALGLLAGNLLSRGPYSPVAVDAGHLVAAASLDQALDKRLASEPQQAAVRVGLSFRDSKGSICRTFQDGAASGLACRAGGKWQIAGLFQGAEGQSSEYRMAAGQDPRLSQLIDQTIAGEPFTAAQERDARRKGWR